MNYLTLSVLSFLIGIVIAYQFVLEVNTRKMCISTLYFDMVKRQFKHERLFTPLNAKIKVVTVASFSFLIALGCIAYFIKDFNLTLLGICILLVFNFVNTNNLRMQLMPMACEVFQSKGLFEAYCFDKEEPSTDDLNGYEYLYFKQFFQFRYIILKYLVLFIIVVYAQFAAM